VERFNRFPRPGCPDWRGGRRDGSSCAGMEWQVTAYALTAPARASSHVESCAGCPNGGRKVRHSLVYI